MTARLNQFSPSCNCCGGCTVLADTFDRSDIGSNWSGRSGSWSIPSGEGSLQTASANAEIDQVAGGTGGLVSASVSSTASGDQLQVGLGASGTYIAAELEVGTGKFRLVSVAGGSRTVLRECDVSADIDESYPISLCSDTYPYNGPGADPTSRLYTATFQGTPYHTWGDAVSGFCESFNAVLATGSLSGVASFVDFSLDTAHCDDASCPNCGQCCWPPGGGDLPEQVQVVISGIGGSSGVAFESCTDAQCDALNGTYILDRTDPVDCESGFDGYPVCACYELSVDFDCDTGSTGSPFIAIRFVAFNMPSANGASGPCNLYVDFLIANGTYKFHFDLGLGPLPGGGAPPCGTYSTTDGCSSATLVANGTSDAEVGHGLRCRHDTVDDGPSATAVVTPI